MSDVRSELLFLDDDPVLLEALARAFEKDGFKVHFTTKSTEARDLLEKNPIGVFFVDCLLPEISGIDFVAQLRTAFPPAKLKVVMMSGVLQDAGFVKETLRATAAVAFLKKPFNLSEALALVDKPTGTVTPVPPRKSLYELLKKGKVESRDKKRAFESLEEVHGYDLPFIYNLLVETKASGYLNMATGNGRVFGITFAQGAIVHVDIDDAETFFGKLLLDRGFVDPEDLKQAMETREAVPKRLGHRLLERSLISPHALDIVMGLQMNIRLSRTILDENINISFVETEIVRSTPFIDSETFISFLHDWISSKISLPWLQAHYMQWSGSLMKKSPSFFPDHSLLKMPLLQSLDGVVDYLVSGKTVSQIADEKKFPEEPLYKAMHLLLVKGLLIFADAEVEKNPAGRLKDLQKIQEKLKGKNRIEAFDIMTKMTGADDKNPDFTMKTFIGMVGEAPSDKEAESRKVFQTIMKTADDAFAFAKKGTNKDRLKQEFSKEDGGDKLRATTLFEEAKNQLQKSMFKAALDNLTKAFAADPQAQQIRLYLIWAKVSMMAHSQNREKLIQEIDMDLLQVPPEDKTGALYHFVLGLVAKIKGDSDSAKKHFDRALQVDGTMMVARRESSMLAKAQVQKKDVLNRDLRELVGSLFSKKK